MEALDHRDEAKRLLSLAETLSTMLCQGEVNDVGRQTLIDARQYIISKSIAHAVLSLEGKWKKSPLR